MQRTIEKLAHERSEKQEALRGKLLKIRERAQALDRLEHDIQANIAGAAPGKKRWFARRRPEPSGGSAAVRDFLSVAVRETKALALAAAELVETGDALADARDKEWDALGSNHVGMIFKSMEWRVDKLSASYDDARALMRTFVLLKDQLQRLTAVLEEKGLPAPASVREILDPIEDIRYTGFENRFRGPEPEIRKQQEKLAGHFKPGGRVLDLGCGRGEFLEILKEQGIAGSGVDGNGQMVEICRDKGLDVRKADILEALAERLIRHTTKPGDLVIDPCAERGEILLAAARLGRRGRFGSVVFEAGRFGRLRLPRQAFLLLAARARPESAECRDGALRPAVRIRLRAEIRHAPQYRQVARGNPARPADRPQQCDRRGRDRADLDRLRDKRKRPRGGTSHARNGFGARSRRSPNRHKPDGHVVGFRSGEPDRLRHARRFSAPAGQEPHHVRACRHGPVGARGAVDGLRAAMRRPTRRHEDDA